MEALKILVLAATLLPLRSAYGDQFIRGTPTAADHTSTEPADVSLQRELIIGGQAAKEKNDYGFFGKFLARIRHWFAQLQLQQPLTARFPF